MSIFNGFVRSAIIGCAALVGSTAGQVFAENPGGWEYSVAPMYLWGKNIDGISTLAGMDAPLELDFKDDILENLDAAFSIHFEARQGDLTLFAEYNYGKLDPSSEANIGPVTINTDIEFRDVMGELGVAYAFYDSGPTRWEVLGGVRQFDQELDVEIDGPDILPEKISGGDDWWHGFGGFRVQRKVSERWTFVGRADIGYKNSNNKAGQVTGFFDYRFRGWGSAFVGYRYLDTDYDNRKSGPDGYGFDAKQQGPIIGLNLYF